ncbi:MAG: histidine kinase [Verrucomicrobiota bacterium]
MHRWFYYILAAVAAWGVFIVLVSAMPVLGGVFTWQQAVRMALNQWLPWMVLSPLIFWFILRFPIEWTGWRWRISAHLIVGVLSVAVCTGLSDYIFVPSLPPFSRDEREFVNRPPPTGNPPFEMNRPPPPSNDAPPADFDRNRPPLWGRVRFNVPIYLTLLSLCHTLVYFRRSQQRDRRALELESQLGQARLQALRMQLHPHFLFNTLNAISTLVQTNPPAANEMIGSLGQMLRLSLDSGSTPEVPLEQELKFLDCYLEIEQIRFGDRLAIKRAIALETRGALVPTFILQPLVENAVRHGIEPSLSPGTIEISSRRDGDVLSVSICDTGVGLAEKEVAELMARNGIGLSNTKARLQSLYPNQHRFSVRNAPSGGCIAKLEMPFHTEPMSTLGVSKES